MIFKQEIILHVHGSRPVDEEYPRGHGKLELVVEFVKFSFDASTP